MAKFKVHVEQSCRVTRVIDFEVEAENMESAVEQVESGAIDILADLGLSADDLVGA